MALDPLPAPRCPVCGSDQWDEAPPSSRKRCRECGRESWIGTDNIPEVIPLSVSVDGADDDRTTLGAAGPGLEEAGGPEQRAWCNLIHRGALPPA